MPRRTRLRALAAGAALAATVPTLAWTSGATASAAPERRGHSEGRGHAAGRGHAGSGKDDQVVRNFMAVDRNTAWTLTRKMKFDFPTYHTEGIARAGNRIFLSTVQVIEPTKKYPAPQGGYDRTPGKGIGHVFVTDLEGHLQKDIVLGEGDMYHPAGVDFDGRDVWVPVAEYRPNSRSIIYRIDARTLGVREAFRVRDHIGGLVRDRVTGHVVGNNWGSRAFYEWTEKGRQVARWDNQSHFVDYQDCMYVSFRKQICGGITNLPQTPAAGGSGARYELGGIGLTDLRSHAILHEVPFQYWSTAGHVATRNPFKAFASGNKLTLWMAPDDGNEGNGSELLVYTATVTPKR